jgi:acetyl esterase/lipase
MLNRANNTLTPALHTLLCIFYTSQNIFIVIIGFWVIFLLFLVEPIQAQRRIPYLTDGLYEVSVVKSVVYGRNIPWGDPQSPPPPVNLTVDIYVPRNDGSVRRPLLILLHGGDFLDSLITQQTDSRRPIPGTPNDLWLAEMAKRMAAKGYLVAIPSYRWVWDNTQNTQEGLQREYYNAIWRAQQDLRACIRYFKKDAVSTNSIYRADTNRIAAGGSGSGAMTAIVAQALLNPNIVSQFPFNRLINYSAEGNADGVIPRIRVAGSSLDDTYLKYSSGVATLLSLSGGVPDTAFIYKGMPPILAIHGAFDKRYNPNLDSLSIPQMRRFLPLAGGKALIQKALQEGNQINLNLPPLPRDTFPGLYWVDSVGYEFYNWYDSGMAVSEVAAAKNHLTWAVNWLTARLCVTLGLDACKIALSRENDASLPNTIQVYPNPTPDKIQLIVHSTINIAITNSFGQIFDTYKFHSGTHAIELSNYPAGLYFIVCRDAVGNLLGVEKVMLNK